MFQKIFEEIGENIKLARKRRSLTAIQVAERAGIDRSTIYNIEKGNPSVSMDAYFNVTSMATGWLFEAGWRWWICKKIAGFKIDWK